MGNGICHVFAQSGFTVSMMDIKQEALDKAIATIGKNMDRQVAKGSLTEEAKQAALSRISTHTDMAEAVKNAQLVVEAATENEELIKDVAGFAVNRMLHALLIAYWHLIPHPYPSPKLHQLRSAPTK